MELQLVTEFPFVTSYVVFVRLATGTCTACRDLPSRIDTSLWRLSVGVLWANTRRKNRHNSTASNAIKNSNSILRENKSAGQKVGRFLCLIDRDAFTAGSQFVR